MDEQEDERSIEELQDEIIWEDGIATLPDEDDSEYVDRQYGREY